MSAPWNVSRPCSVYGEGLAGSMWLPQLQGYKRLCLHLHSRQCQLSLSTNLPQNLPKTNTTGSHQWNADFGSGCCLGACSKGELSLSPCSPRYCRLSPYKFRYEVFNAVFRVTLHILQLTRKTPRTVQKKEYCSFL